MSSESAKPGHRISAGEIRKQCKTLLGSRTFAQGHQLRKLLTFMVRRSLLSGHQRITQQVIARDVLGNADFDPTVSSSVRRLAARLRERIRDYYAEEGRKDAVVVEFPKGQPYRLVVKRRRLLEMLHPLDDRAFVEYQKGRSLWAAGTPESLHSATDCFRRAIALVPSYSAAHSALGECHAFMVVRGASPRENMLEAKSRALRALEIDDNNAGAHALLAVVLSSYDWNWARATQEFELALSLDDKDPGTYGWYAAHLVSIGRYDEAVRAARLAQAAESPAPSALVNAHAAKVFLASGRYDDTLSLLDRLQKENPGFYVTYLCLGILEGIVRSNHSLAIQSLERAAELSPGDTSVLAALGFVFAKAGRTADAESLLSTLLDRRRHTYVPATDLASLYSALGQSDQAFDWLDRALKERSLFLTWFVSWPPLKVLSLDQRAKRILSRLGLRR